MRKPEELTELKINVKADSDMAVNQINKLSYAMSQLNSQLRETAKLQGLLKKTSWIKKILRLIKK